MRVHPCMLGCGVARDGCCSPRRIGSDYSPRGSRSCDSRSGRALARAGPTLRSSSLPGVNAPSLKHAPSRMTVSHLLTRADRYLVEHLCCLAEHAPLPMVATEGRAHVVCYVNPAFGRLVGQSVGPLWAAPCEAVFETRRVQRMATATETETETETEMAATCSMLCMQLAQPRRPYTWRACSATAWRPSFPVQFGQSRVPTTMLGVSSFRYALQPLRSQLDRRMATLKTSCEMSTSDS
jgi:hypothetical protein